MGLMENIEDQFILPEQESGIIQNVRRSAYESFQRLGIPSTRHEEWKYTHIKTNLPETLIINNEKLKASRPINRFERISSNRLVFINGAFKKELSSLVNSKGLTISSLKEQFAAGNEVIDKHFGKLVRIREEHFASLNTAFATDGAFIHLAKGVTIEEPLLILFLYDAPESFIQSRSLIIAEENSTAHFVVDFQCTAPSFYNHVSEVYLGKNASLNVTQLQTATAGATGVHTTETEVKRDGRFTLNSITLEGKMIRNNVNVSLIGEHSEAHLNGLYYAKSTSHFDNHLKVDHIAPHCQSNQFYKGILDDESTGVFNGRIFVKQDAQKTNAFQSSKAILLSQEASMNSKPQLEIFADDVKCSHGAAIGQLNEKEIFYLRARGIHESDARAILAFAYAAQMLDPLPVPSLRDYLEQQLRERLHLEL